jgi:hypothetical protein
MWEIDEGTPVVERTAELEMAIATLIGRRVLLTWPEPTTSHSHHARQLANAREVRKSAKRQPIRAACDREDRQR